MLPGKTLVGAKKIDGLVYVAVVDVESIRKHLAPVTKEEHEWLASIGHSTPWRQPFQLKRWGGLKIMSTTRDKLGVEPFKDVHPREQPCTLDMTTLTPT